MKNKKTEFTPGPWRLDMPENVAESSIVDSNDNLVVAGEGDGWMRPFACSENAEANAHLIAAAPDLYEALEQTLSCIDQHDDDPVIGPIIEQARGATAKARGES